MAEAVLANAREACALEIGGPSRVFGARGMLPVYPRLARVDNINFAAETAWEQSLRDGSPFLCQPGRSAGTQWLREATALEQLADHRYDLVLSSHCLEHVANPLAALREWRRVTRPDGRLVLVLPDREKTFDHRRPVTTLAHLRDDCAARIGEDDRTHIDEVIALHDRTRDPAAGSAEEFRARCEQNAVNRCLHHHVFDLELAAAALRETGWEPLALEKARPLHLVAFARKAG